MMTDWSERMIQTLQLNGKSERTQESYVRTVRMLTEYYHKTPDSITEDELRKYFLHRRNVNLWSPKTMRICYCGIRFFYTNVLQHDWHIFNIGCATNLWVTSSHSHPMLPKIFPAVTHDTTA